jgi:hypothetical protein
MHLRHGISSASISPSNVQALAARNLNLLHDIESTLAALNDDTKLFDAITATFEEVTNRLKANPPESAVDADGETSNILVQTADSTRRLYERAVSKRESARADLSLTDDDGVVDAYDALISSLRNLFDAIEVLREWIETFDAILEPALEGVFSTVDDLFAAMGVKR